MVRFAESRRFIPMPECGKLPAQTRFDDLTARPEIHHVHSPGWAFVNQTARRVAKPYVAFSNNSTNQAGGRMGLP